MILSTFQNDLSIAVESLLRDLSIYYVKREQGEEEVYLLFQINKLQIYLYKDGAEFSSNRIDQRYELQDFNDLEELKKKFFEDLSSFLSLLKSKDS